MNYKQPQENYLVSFFFNFLAVFLALVIWSICVREYAKYVVENAVMKAENKLKGASR